MAEADVSFELFGDRLPTDAHAVSFRAEEALSHPYQAIVRFSTRTAGFSAADLLRSRVCLGVFTRNGATRWFDGIVETARFVQVVGDELWFDVTLRPALAALAHREGSRIFQEKTIVQIVQSVFEDAGFAEEVEWRITKEYEPREYVVQYRESHLAFVSRLLEENGIFYFFSHSSDGHRMILGDDASAFAPSDGAIPVLFALASGGIPGAEPLDAFRRSRALRENRVDLLDYDFEKPGHKPEASQGTHDGWPLHRFEYPGGFVKGSAGARLASARLAELRRDADVVDGKSRAVGLSVGEPFTVTAAAEAELAGTFVLTRLVSSGSQTLTGGERNLLVENDFEGIPEGTPWAPERRTPRPRISGLQTATVTGSSRQEQTIHVDKYGRIKVRFHWDRVGQQDHTSSMWIRCTQVAMGGSMALPRVGWEVSVAFMNGDPDRPVVLGRVYNAEKTPPSELPAQKASASLKSMSSPGGGGHNEISMGDSAGGQGMGIHAQKDLNVTINNDKHENVGGNEAVHLSVNGSDSIGVDETVKVGGNQKTSVGAVLSHHVGGNQSTTVGGNDVENAISNLVEKIAGDRGYQVGGNQITISNGVTQTVTGNISRDVGAVELTATTSSIDENVLGSVTENVGAIKAIVTALTQAEKIAGSKNVTSLAAELHLTKGGLASTTAASVTNLVGGLHYQKLGGNYVVKAPMVTLLGAVGIFKAGGTSMKLGGAPIVIKSPKISAKGALVLRMGASMKMG